MGGGRGRGKPPDTTKLYKDLGVEKGASADEIRKLAVKNHPDKGGDPEKFKDIQRAFDVLGNEQKRETYDRYGEEGLQDGGDGGGPGDIFDVLSGRRGSRRPQGVKKDDKKEDKKEDKKDDKKKDGKKKDDKKD